MNFDPLSFVIGKHGDSGPVRDVVSYLIGRAGEVWQTLTDVAVATFTTVSTSLRELVIDVTPVQSGSGDPTPENPLPISGRTGSNVVTAKSTPYCQINKSGGFWQGAAGQVESDGATIRRTFNTNSNINTLIPTSQLDTFLSDRTNLPAGAYTCSADVDISVSGVSVSFIFSDANGNNPIWIANGTTGNIPDGFKLQIIEILKNGERVSFTEADHIYVSNIVVAIAPRIYRITFPVAVGTVYGGTLRDNGDGTWILTVTHANIASYAGESINEPWISSMDVYAAGATPTTGAQVVYPLTTPVNYDLTAESVKALLGQNNIFADTGNINTITFRTQ